MAASYGRRTLRQFALPAAITITVHLLLIFVWSLDRAKRPLDAPDSARQILTVLLQPPSPKIVRPAAAIGKATKRRKPEAVNIRQAPSQKNEARKIVQAAEKSSERVEPVPTASAADIMERARPDIGKIDRELRGTALLVPAERPDSRQIRLERGIAGAFIDRSTGFVLERYVSPDGVAITRKTGAGGVVCYMSGTVNFVPGILHNSATPQKVHCPPQNSGWTRI